MVDYLSIFHLEATYTRYEAPTIQSLSSSVGGTKGSVNDFSGEQIIASVQDNPPVLLVHTNGESIKITGNNFGKPYAGDVTKFNEDYVIYKVFFNVACRWCFDGIVHYTITY